MSNEIIAPNIVDNSPQRELINVIKNQLKKSKEAKFAIGYFFLSGFSLVKDDFPESYILTKPGWLKRWSRNDASVYASELVLDSKGKLIDISFKKHENVYQSDVSAKEVNTTELTEEVSIILGTTQISQKEKSDFEIALKDYAVYYEDDDIVKNSLIRAINNKLENEFCSNIDKISKIKINQNKRDLVVAVYL
ncbi:MAG: hypothetical protein L6244_06825 [Candidatus Methanoperedenaceae archaeon]|nr:hypothetical protein [Candidatus Methanoperedenaceae archaeon]